MTSYYYFINIKVVTCNAIPDMEVNAMFELFVLSPVRPYLYLWYLCFRYQEQERETTRFEEFCDFLANLYCVLGSLVLCEWLLVSTVSWIASGDIPRKLHWLILGLILADICLTVLGVLSTIVGNSWQRLWQRRSRGEEREE